MAGIAGLFSWGASPPSAALVTAMIERLAHRGPDGRKVVSAGPAALGLAAFRTQADRPADEAPLAAPDAMLVADARLDNRAALARWLDLDTDATSDGQLILAGLRRGGAKAADRFLGDFAVAHMDIAAGLLTCVRDPMGVKPLYYAGGPQCLAFASECKALLGLPFVTGELDEETLADFATGIVDDHGRTFFRNIRRLPAFHALQVGGDGAVAVERYGDVRAEGSVPPGDAPDRLRALLREAVACRLSGAVSAGLLLSGGLDSSSLAMLADEIRRTGDRRPVRTYSAVFDSTPDASERPQIEAVLARGTFDPVILDRSALDPLGGLPAILRAQDQPVIAPGLGLLQTVYDAAAADGVTVLLDGHGGDEVISHGFGRLGELARSARWLALWHALSSVSRLYGEARLSTLLRYGTRYGSGPAWSLARKAMRLRRSLRRRHRGHQAAIGEGDRQADAIAASRRLRAVTEVESRVSSRRAAGAVRFEDEAAAHRQNLTSGFQAYALEVLDHGGAAAGLEPRFPFLDRRVVAFCLGLPSEAKLGQGYTRLVLRQAMEGLLPPLVQWRPDKLDFGVHLADGLTRYRLDDLDAAILADDTVLAVAFDMTMLRSAYRRFRAEGPATSGADLHLVWRAAVLALWLRDHRPAGAIGATDTSGSPE